MQEQEVVDVPTQPSKQFQLASLFWVTFAIGLGIAYLQRLDSPDILLGGFLTIFIGLLCGLAIGYATGRVADGVFWATLISAFGYLSVASDPIYNHELRIAWALLGAIVGGLASCLTPGFDRKSLLISCAACALAAGVVMWGYALLRQPASFDSQFDQYAAPVIGVLIVVFIRLIVWLESKRNMARYVTATWLLGVVIVGNLLARYGLTL